MHNLAKATLTFDKEPHPQEEAIQSLVSESMPEVAPLIQQARAIGIPWATLFALLLQYGPNFAALLQAILAALNQPPPGPMAKKTDEAPPEVAPEEEAHGKHKGKHHASEK
jgi:hypothetical protein